MDPWSKTIFNAVHKEGFSFENKNQPNELNCNTMHEMTVMEVMQNAFRNILGV